MDFSKYRTVVQVAREWELSERRVCKFCQKKRIRGIKKIGGMYFIPCDAKKPIDLGGFRGLDMTRRRTER